MIDGVIRDCEEVIEVGLPVYARGSVSCAGDKEGPGRSMFRSAAEAWWSVPEISSPPTQAAWW